jgi:transposase-like protein
MTDCPFRQSSRAAAGSDDRRLDAGAVSSMSTCPTRYSAEIAERILQKLQTGRSLRHVCKDNGMPPESTVRNWVADDREGFTARYSHARKVGRKAMADRKLEIVDRILGELMNGRTLRDVCRDDGLPAHNTVLAWMADHRVRYNQARKLGYEAMADEILEIADDSRNDWKRNKAGTKLILDRANIARAQLRINARRWLLSKALPKI